MKEIAEILDCVSSFVEGQKAVLATVVELRGSGYRLPGARMLISEAGGPIGTVSGGCLEADVLERAKRVLSTEQPEVFTYDTTENEDSVFSLNMGCRGVIRILLEPIRKESALITALKTAFNERRRQTVATLITAPQQSDAKIGDRLIYSGGGAVTADGLSASLTGLAEITGSLQEFFSSGQDRDMRSFETIDGKYEFAFEQIQPPISLLVFGAGADGVPMARISAELGWQTSVHDHRPAYLTTQRFPSVKKLVRDPADSVAELSVDDRTAAVVITHNYARDRVILPALLRSPAFYIGLLGPKSRTQQLLDELSGSGQYFSDEQLSRIYAPVGLDIGGDTPETIGLAIASEIQSVLRSRSGGPLRRRDAPIYDHQE